MKYLKKYKLLILIIISLFVFTSYSSCSANNELENVITKDFELSSVSSAHGEMVYGVYLKKDNENIPLSIKAADYNLPSNLFDYKDYIRLRITYSQEDNEVLDCKVINYKNSEIIEDLSEENMNRLFNIEYGKNIIENNWVDAIKLSELKENEVYKYTANATTQFPKIENDIGKNCIVYIKEKDNKNYEKEIKIYKEISGSSISGSFNEYNSGDSFSIMYSEIENEELLKIIPEDEIIYLSNYNDGEELKYSFEKYIYNNTEKNISIQIKDTFLGTESSDSFIIEKGKIYGFDWMIDSAVISYVEESNDKETDVEVEEENPPKEQIKVDNIETPSKLPQTGREDYMPIIILISAVIMVGIMIKLRKFKNIE